MVLNGFVFLQKTWGRAISKKCSCFLVANSPRKLSDYRSGGARVRDPGGVFVFFF